MKVHRLVLGPISTNTYVVEGETALIVIDPAGEYEKLIDLSDKLGKQIKYVLLTHAHFDHCGAAAAMKRDGAEIYMSEKDAELSAAGGHLSPDPNFPLFLPDVKLYGGEKLSLSGINFDVIATPGHTAGGMTYVADNCVFCGDTLFRRGIGRTDLPSGNFDAIIDSVKKILDLPGDMIVYPGHDEITSLSYERANNPYV